MIRRIQALNYRCLRYVDVRLDRFHVLVGPNASGKSTLLDVVTFLGDMLSSGLESAVEKRTRNFQDLVWGRPRKDLGFELAVEFDIPKDAGKQLPRERKFRTFRYEIAIKGGRNGIRIDSERALLMPHESHRPRQEPEPLRFPDPPEASDTILIGGRRRGSRTVLSKSREGRDSFNIEVSEKAGRGWVISISFRPGEIGPGESPRVSREISRLHPCQATAGNRRAGPLPG